MGAVIGLAANYRAGALGEGNGTYPYVYGEIGLGFRHFRTILESKPSKSIAWPSTPGTVPSLNGNDNKADKAAWRKIFISILSSEV